MSCGSGAYYRVERASVSGGGADCPVALVLTIGRNGRLCREVGQIVLWLWCLLWGGTGVCVGRWGRLSCGSGAYYRAERASVSGGGTDCPVSGGGTDCSVALVLTIGRNGRLCQEVGQIVLCQEVGQIVLWLWCLL